jgi:hypothetical protein
VSETTTITVETKDSTAREQIANLAGRLYDVDLATQHRLSALEAHGTLDLGTLRDQGQRIATLEAQAGIPEGPERGTHSARLAQLEALAERLGAKLAQTDRDVDYWCGRARHCEGLEKRIAALEVRAGYVSAPPGGLKADDLGTALVTPPLNPELLRLQGQVVEKDKEIEAWRTRCHRTEDVLGETRIRREAATKEIERLKAQGRELRAAQEERDLLKEEVDFLQKVRAAQAHTIARGFAPHDAVVADRDLLKRRINAAIVALGTDIQRGSHREAALSILSGKVDVP